jgi:hypothetical protein
MSKASNVQIITIVQLRTQTLLARAMTGKLTRWDTAEMRALATVLTAHADALDREAVTEAVTND